MNEARPLRLWNAKRTLRKGLVASTISELCEKGKRLFNYADSTAVTVVLEEDGTEVDEDYFQFLEKDTTLQLLKPDEQWHPDGYSVEDEIDYGGGDVSDCNVPAHSALRQISDLLKKDMGNLVLLQPAQLQVIVDTDVAILRRKLGFSADVADVIHSASQRYLDMNAEAEDARQLLKLLSQDQSTSNQEMPSSSIDKPESLQTAGVKRKREEL